MALYPPDGFSRPGPTGACKVLLLPNHSTDRFHHRNKPHGKGSLVAAVLLPVLVARQQWRGASAIRAPLGLRPRRDTHLLVVSLGRSVQNRGRDADILLHDMPADHRRDGTNPNASEVGTWRW